jgi:parallel beta-helix repeat protein
MCRYLRFQLKTSILSVLVILSTLVLGVNINHSPVLATYVEGFLDRDTVWSLTDSPLLLTNDLIVNSNVTLTIEPGVEVRFGGNFSLIVEGNLYAVGMEENNITFSSNKNSPEAGDWGSLSFRFSPNSSLRYISVKYASRGIFAEGANLKLQNCYISESSKDGIFLLSSTMEARENVVVNNLGNGIHLSGDNEAIIENNLIKSSMRGIVLEGESTLGLSITDNIITSNTQSGLQLAADAYANIEILQNTFTGNLKGIHISGNAVTSITNNTVSHNSIGVYYETGQNHSIHFSDLYGNELGMDISPTVTVTATYNYWGNANGPYHTSLNPEGKGNQILGDGANLDFIPFLTYPTGHMNQRPTAWLMTDKNSTRPNQTINFLATNSYDDGKVEEFFFDFGDGENSGWTTLSIVTHQYSSIGNYDATLAVKDDFGVTSGNNAMVTIQITNLDPLNVQLNINTDTITSEEQTSIEVYVTNESDPTNNADIVIFSVKDGIFTPSTGSTNATGYFMTVLTAPKVYERSNLRITVTASKTGYSDGSTYEYISVRPPLAIQVTTDPGSIRSEDTIIITTHVSYDGQPVTDVIVSASADGGSLMNSLAITNENGAAEFTYTAPLVLLLTEINMTVEAYKSGYKAGLSQETLVVEPKVLTIQVTADPDNLFLEDVSTITVLATYETNPTSGVLITISSDYGEGFAPQNKTTDTNGICTFTFTPSQGMATQNIIITAVGQKTGYVNGGGQTQLLVNLKIFSAELFALSNTVASGKPTIIMIHVSSYGSSISDAQVVISSDSEGYFTSDTALTDKAGNCTFVFTAPEAVTESNVTITAVTNKTGYIDLQTQVELLVIPLAEAPGGGLPITTILMLLVPIVIVVVILILIKLKIVSFSSEEE